MKFITSGPSLQAMVTVPRSAPVCGGLVTRGADAARNSCHDRWDEGISRLARGRCDRRRSRARRTESFAQRGQTSYRSAGSMQRGVGDRHRACALQKRVDRTTRRTSTETQSPGSAREKAASLETALAIARHAEVLPLATCGDLASRAGSTSRLVAGYVSYLDRQISAELSPGSEARTVS